MPRVADPEKDEYAKILLSQKIPIQKIRIKLKEIFGEAISPNRLIEFKKNLEKTDKPNFNEENLGSIPFLIKSKSRIKKKDKSLKETMRQNTILIEKLWKQIQKIDNRVENFAHTIKNFSESLNQIRNKSKSEEKVDNLSDDRILDELNDRKAQVTDILMNYKTISGDDLQKKTKFEPKILSWVLNQLQEIDILEIEVIKNQEMYSLKFG